jgi:hypothetical protein
MLSNEKLSPVEQEYLDKLSHDCPEAREAQLLAQGFRQMI